MPRKFDFISPDIVLNEVDESVLPAPVTEVGPLLIGQAERGPAMKPVRISSLSDLYSIFGRPINGKGTADVDVWRDGNRQNPTYAMYAAQAHLASNSTPVTMVRLVGEQDDNATGTKAGWKLGGASTNDVATNKTAYGLFVVASASATTNATGSLAAVFYAVNAGLKLSGETAAGVSAQKGAAGLIKSSGAGEFTMIVETSDGEGNSIVFGLDPNTQDTYIRNKFKTNPQLIEASSNFDNVTAVNYWLGETFEQDFLDNVGGGATGGDQYAVLLPLESSAGESGNWGNHEFAAQQAKSGYFLNRKVGGTRDKLFRLVAHSAGEWESKNLKVEIRDLVMGNSQNPNSSFAVRIMKGKQILETFSNCNLDITSENFVAKRIGDQRLSWDATNKKYNVLGEYPNQSDYVYIELDPAVANQALGDAFALPVGFEGPLKHKGFSFKSGSANVLTKAASPSSTFSDAYIKGGTGVAVTLAALAGDLVGGLPTSYTASFNFPELRLTTENSKQGGNYQATDTFGVRHVQGTGISQDSSYIDLTRVLPNNIVAANNSFESSFTFSLEEMTASNGEYFFKENTMTYGEGGTATLKSLLDLGVKQFCAPMVGGFDGVDIKKVAPFADKNITGTRITDYVKFTYEKALDTIADSEVVEYELLSIPGITNTVITNRVIQTCEERGDSLAIVDLSGIHKHKFEATNQTNGTAGDVIDTANTRLINSSFAASYYPSVRVTDTANDGNNVFVAPPSIAAIGAIAKSQGLSEPWFAPAGFNRGGINELGGSQGPRVYGTLEHLSKADRDDLYQVNINPIARFPASGQIVIFGQKTMTQTASALDRINVRRLLLHLKRRIGKVAETILFDQNVTATWNRFKFQAEQILSDVQARLGITEFKLVLDETTTTADLVDRNILYAKVLIKPARAIEFIVVDFVVTRSGIEL